MTRFFSACIVALALALAGLPSFAADDGLDAVLAAQPDDVKARYSSRHPAETLRFFGIKPGMTVVEALPGGGWYSNILKSWLGGEGTLIGVDYAVEMYPKFNFYDDEYLEAKKTWSTTWPAAMTSEGDAAVKAFHFGSMPDDMAGTADVVLLIRALHNLARYEDDGGYLSTGLNDIRRILKPGGLVGVVQHRAPDTNSDAWANGSNGYLKRQFVIDTMINAGFELVSETAINTNPADQPSESERVWRLPPVFAGDATMKEKYAAIGESNRMTLLFRRKD